MADSQLPFRIIAHGGYVNENNKATKPFRQESMRLILQMASEFAQNNTAIDTAAYTASLLEDDKLFNAGTGSLIQSDGEIRMTASLIDSQTRKLSGVLNIQNVRNPILIAKKLQNQTDCILAGDCATNWAKENGFDTNYNPETPARRQLYEECKASGDFIAQQLKNVQQKEETPRTGTIGCVVLKNGIIATATSTGGKGMEVPGRVSDSGTVAGCFANKSCGVSITGVGENAISISMASAICIRRHDGMPLQQALDRTIEELNEIDGLSGAICCDIDGNLAYKANLGGMCWAWYKDGHIEVFD